MRGGARYRITNKLIEVIKEYSGFRKVLKGF